MCSSNSSERGADSGGADRFLESRSRAGGGRVESPAVHNRLRPDPVLPQGVGARHPRHPRRLRAAQQRAAPRARGVVPHQDRGGRVSGGARAGGAAQRRQRHRGLGSSARRLRRQQARASRAAAALAALAGASARARGVPGGDQETQSGRARRQAQRNTVPAREDRRDHAELRRAHEQEDLARVRDQHVQAFAGVRGDQDYQDAGGRWRWRQQCAWRCDRRSGQWRNRRRKLGQYECDHKHE